MKTILLTFSVTVSAIVLILALFLNPILGKFGLVATSVETLQGLTAASRVMERMKARQVEKKTGARKRFAKKATRRVSSMALAAATIGTPAVIVTMVGLEIADYCEERKAWTRDENLLNGTTMAFDFEQCMQDGKADAEQLVAEMEKTSRQTTADAIAATREYSHAEWSALKQAYADAVASASHASSNVWDSIQSWVLNWQSGN